jgi:hypothetical protein
MGKDLADQKEVKTEIAFEVWRSDTNLALSDAQDNGLTKLH